MRSLFLPLLAALLVLPLTACDETGPMLSIDSIDVAVDDAVIARDQGNFPQAESLLRQAYEAEPQNAEVRVELATTILQRDGIDLVDLDRIGQYLTTQTGTGTATSGSQTAARGECAYATEPGSEVFDPTDIDGFDDLVAGAATLDEAAALLDGVVPPQIQSFDLCTTVVDGDLIYDQEGALAELGTQDLSEAQVAQALAVSALTDFVDAYLFVAEELPAETVWYRLADGSVGICAPDEAELRASMEAPVEAFGEAVLALDARAELIGGSVAAEIVDTALQAYEELEEAVVYYCGT